MNLIIQMSGSSTLQFQKTYVTYYTINRHCGHEYLGTPEIPKASLVGLNSIQREVKEEKTDHK